MGCWHDERVHRLHECMDGLTEGSLLACRGLSLHASRGRTAWDYGLYIRPQADRSNSSSYKAVAAIWQAGMYSFACRVGCCRSALSVWQLN